MLVEEFVAGQELTASILDGRALPLIRIEAPQRQLRLPQQVLLRRDEVLLPGGPARSQGDGDPRECLRAFDLVGCSGWGRLDLILRADGTFSFLEVNTSPGMTGHSLVPMAARAGGHVRIADLCVEILRGAHVG